MRYPTLILSSWGQASLTSSLLFTSKTTANHTFRTSYIVCWSARKQLLSIQRSTCYTIIAASFSCLLFVIHQHSDTMPPAVKRQRLAVKSSITSPKQQTTTNISKYTRVSKGIGSRGSKKEANPTTTRDTTETTVSALAPSTLR